MITGKQAAFAAEAAVTNNPPILYSDEDCQRFIKNTILRAGGDIQEYSGSNDMYRNACAEILPLAIARLQPGMVLFIVKSDGGEPEKYKADGKGNASHIGWYTGGTYEVVHSSASRGMVASSTLSNGWTHAGYLKALTYNGTAEPVAERVVGFIDLPAEENVFHRISPSQRSAYWGRINGGTEVEIVSEGPEWTRIIYGTHDGYVMSNFITRTLAHDTPPATDYAKLMQAIDLLRQVAESIKQ